MHELVHVVIWLNNNKHIIIAAIYHPPNSDLLYIDDMCNSIEDLSSRHRNYVLWVGGDLNLPDINWPDCTIQGHSFPTDINKRFLDIIHILAIFITNGPSLTPQCHTIPHNTRTQPPPCNIYSLISTSTPSKTCTQKNSPMATCRHRQTQARCTLVHNIVHRNIHHQ